MYHSIKNKKIVLLQRESIGYTHTGYNSRVLYIYGKKDNLGSVTDNNPTQLTPLVLLACPASPATAM